MNGKPRQLFIMLRGIHIVKYVFRVQLPVGQLDGFLSPFIRIYIKWYVNKYAERGISLNNDYNNRYKRDTESQEKVKKQQTFPGFPFQPIGQPGMGGQPPQMGRPGMGGQPPQMGRPGMGGQPPQMGRPGQPPMGQPGMGQPLSAPPNFTPELPRMEGQPFGGPSAPQFGRPEERGRERGNMGNFFPGNMDIRRCMNRFTYVWLINGNNFWFYPVNIRRPFVEGFRWRRNHWEFDRINMNRILFFRCF